MKTFYYFLLTTAFFFSSYSSSYAQCPDAFTAIISNPSGDDGICTFDVNVTITSNGNSSAEIWISVNEGGTITEYGNDGNCDATSLSGPVDVDFISISADCDAIVTAHFRGHSSPSCGGSTCEGEIEPFGALPVDLVAFNAYLKDDAILVNWLTASEENNDYFDLQYSTNGLDFRTISTIEGEGTTSEVQRYEYLHTDIERGDNFYRIKQVDYDGNFEIFDIVVVTVKGDKDIFNIYPSQVFNEINFETPSRVDKETEINIYNTSGLLMQRGTLVPGEYKLSFDVSNLPAGVYFVRFVNEDFEYTAKQFFKMED